VVLAMLLWSGTRVLAQSLSIDTSGDVLKVRAAGFSFLKGEPVARLKDGRSQRVEMTVTAIPAPGKEPIAATRRIFALSYDLWEERFAVTTVGVRTQSVSHLPLAAAEAWCVEQMTVPLSAIGRGVSFWVRLEYRLLDADADAATEASDSGYTLQSLIDALSRRRKSESSPHALEAGPFRTPARAPSSAR
jgi:hypothetical protein